MMEATEMTFIADGRRLDVLLSEQSGLTRSRVATLMEEGRVTVDGQVVTKAGLKAKAGQTVVLTIPAPKPAVPEAQDIPLTILYEDADLAVVVKPCGMVVHPAPGHPDGTLVNAPMQHCGDSLSGINGEIRPGIVHRIDMDTSGLIIAAKNDAAHRALADQLKDHTLHRVYEAVVCGRVRDDRGTVDAPIGRHPTDRKRQSVNAKVSREAVTHYEVIARYNGYTHIRCRLETGRTHQIRVHMSSIGYPLVGDLVYGRKKAEKGISGQCLHAKELGFIHPTTGEKVHLVTELPEYFKAVLSKLGPAD